MPGGRQFGGDDALLEHFPQQLQPIPAVSKMTQRMSLDETILSVDLLATFHREIAPLQDELPIDVARTVENQLVHRRCVP